MAVFRIKPWVGPWQRVIVLLSKSTQSWGGCVCYISSTALVEVRLRKETDHYLGTGWRERNQRWAKAWEPVCTPKPGMVAFGVEKAGAVLCFCRQGGRTRAQGLDGPVVQSTRGPSVFSWDRPRLEKVQKGVGTWPSMAMPGACRKAVSAFRL